MKIFTSAQIHELDKFTIENEPIKSIDLMERAAKALAHAIATRWDVSTPVVVFAGPGNNGGDALAVARLLAENPEAVRSSTINLFLLLTVLYAFCVLFCRAEDDEIRGFSNVFWLACAAQVFAGINNLAGRVTWYFMPTLIILIPNLVINMNIKEKQTLKYLAAMIGILACIVGLYFFKTDMVALAYPYEPFWIQR